MNKVLDNTFSLSLIRNKYGSITFPQNGNKQNKRNNVNVGCKFNLDFRLCSTSRDDLKPKR